MNIIICGAGEVGAHAAETLAAAGHRMTVIDKDLSRIATLEEALDVRVLRGNCADAAILREAGASSADLIIGATSNDEVNLLSATIGKALGTGRSIARVHHSSYYEPDSFDYAERLGIDHLICPEFLTAIAIGQTLRNPGAMAIETFAQGQIEMQQFPVSDNADAIGHPLDKMRMPRMTRIAAISREGGAFIPTADTIVEPGDNMIIVGDPDHFPVARRFFQSKGDVRGKRRIVIMGGPHMATWLCTKLRNRNFGIRLFEVDRTRAEFLADKLDWVTVLHGDPTDRDLFEEEQVSDADAFVALTHDEENILGCVLAKSRGVKQVMAVIERPKYLYLLPRVGIDHTFSPRMQAVREIERIIDTRPLTTLASLAEGEIDVYRVRIADTASVIGKPLREIKLAPNYMLAAIQRNGDSIVPGANDQIEKNDTLLVLGRSGQESALKKILQ